MALSVWGKKRERRELNNQGNMDGKYRFKLVLTDLFAHLKQIIVTVIQSFRGIMAKIRDSDAHGV